MPITPQEALQRTIEHREIFHDEMLHIMRMIMNGDLSPLITAALITLGPLTNPAGAPNILMGVFHSDLVGIQIRALQRLGAEHALVVYGRDGMDEVSLGATTLVGELKDGHLTEYEIHPEDFGMAMASHRALRVETPEESQAVLRGVLNNEAGAARDIVILNAGAALYAANVTTSIKDGIALARQVIESGAAKEKLAQFVAFTQKSGSTA